VNNKLALTQKIYKGGDKKTFQLKAVTPFNNPLYIKIEVIEKCNVDSFKLVDGAPKLLKLSGIIPLKEEVLALDTNPVDKFFTSDNSACPITFSVVQDNDDKTDLSEENKKLFSIVNNKITINQKLYYGWSKVTFQLKGTTSFGKPLYIKIEATKAPCD